MLSESFVLCDVNLKLVTHPSYGMFMGFHILVGSSIHSVWSSLFVLTAEVVPEPRRVANGAVFNFGKWLKKIKVSKSISQGVIHKC